MTCLAAKDMKNTRELWRLLEEHRQLIITRNGRPCAVLVGVSPETADELIHEIRRGLFSLAVRNARRAAGRKPVTACEIEREIAAVRSRGSS